MSDLRSELERRARRTRRCAPAPVPRPRSPQCRRRPRDRRTHSTHPRSSWRRSAPPHDTPRLKSAARSNPPLAAEPLASLRKASPGGPVGARSHAQQRGEIGDALPHARGRPHRADARDRTRTPAPRLSSSVVLQVRCPGRCRPGHDAPHHASDAPAPQRWGRVRDTRHSNRHAPGEPGALHAFENSMIH